MSTFGLSSSPNRILNASWLSSAASSHTSRLESVRSAVDCSAPIIIRLNRTKHENAQEERQHEIDRANRMLLMKMEQVKGTTPEQTHVHHLLNQHHNGSSGSGSPNKGLMHARIRSPIVSPSNASHKAALAMQEAAISIAAEATSGDAHADMSTAAQQLSTMPHAMLQSMSQSRLRSSPRRASHPNPHVHSHSADHPLVAAPPCRSLNLQLRQREHTRILQSNTRLILRLAHGRSHLDSTLDLVRHQQLYNAARDAAIVARKPPPSIPRPRFVIAAARNLEKRARRRKERHEQQLDPKRHSLSIEKEKSEPIANAAPAAAAAANPINAVAEIAAVSNIDGNGMSTGSISLAPSVVASILSSASASAPAAVVAPPAPAPAASSSVVFRVVDHVLSLTSTISVPLGVLGSLWEVLAEPTLLWEGKEAELVKAVYHRMRMVPVPAIGGEGKDGASAGARLQFESNDEYDDDDDDMPRRMTPSSSTVELPLLRAERRAKSGMSGLAPHHVNNTSNMYSSANRSKDRRPVSAHHVQSKVMIAVSRKALVLQQKPPPPSQHQYTMVASPRSSNIAQQSLSPRASAIESKVSTSASATSSSVLPSFASTSTTAAPVIVVVRDATVAAPSSSHLPPMRPTAAVAVIPVLVSTAASTSTTSIAAKAKVQQATPKQREEHKTNVASSSQPESKEQSKQ